MAVVKARARIAGDHARTEPRALALVPAHLKEISSGLMDVLTAYYRWADLPDNFQNDAKRLVEFTDRDVTTSEFLQYIKNMFLRLFPNKTEANTRHVLMFARDFYAKRGTLASYEFLFRALYNEDVQLIFPSKYLFQTSNGIWVKNTILKCLSTDGDIDKLLGRRLYGVSSGASALIKSAVFYAVDTDVIGEFTVSDTKGTLLVDEILETRDNQRQVKTRTFGQIGTYTINSGGAGYREGSLIPMSGGDGAGATIRVGAIDSYGKILSLEIISSGIGYVSSAPVMNLAASNLFDPDLVQAVADIDLVISAKYTTPGAYETLKSAPSDVFKLHDGAYYQEYSYVLKTNVPLATFQQPVYDLVHPAGTTMFSQPDLISDSSKASNNTGSFLYQYSRPASVNYNNPAADSGRKYFDMEIKMFNPVISDLHATAASHAIGIAFDEVAMANAMQFYKNYNVIINKKLSSNYKSLAKDYVISYKAFIDSGEVAIFNTRQIEYKKEMQVDPITAIKTNRICIAKSIDGGYSNTFKSYDISYKTNISYKSNYKLANARSVMLNKQLNAVDLIAFNSMYVSFNRSLKSNSSVKTDKVINTELTGSRYLYSIWYDELEDLEPLLNYYGLSPVAKASEVVLLS